MMRTITGIAKRKKEKVEEEPTEVTEISPPPVSKELKRRWSYFIRKVYETDPFVCPKCAGEMGIISFIDQAEVIIHTKTQLNSSLIASWGSNPQQPQAQSGSEL